MASFSDLFVFLSHKACVCQEDVVSKGALPALLSMAGSFFEAFLLAMRPMFVRRVLFVVSSRGLPVALLYMTAN